MKSIISKLFFSEFPQKLAPFAQPADPVYLYQAIEK